MVNPNVLIMHAREAGVDDVELQNAQGCVPEGTQGSVVGGDSADCMLSVARAADLCG